MMAKCWPNCRPHVLWSLASLIKFDKFDEFLYQMCQVLSTFGQTLPILPPIIKNYLLVYHCRQKIQGLVNKSKEFQQSFKNILTKTIIKAQWTPRPAWASGTRRRPPAVPTATPARSHSRKTSSRSSKTFEWPASFRRAREPSIRWTRPVSG